MLKKYDEYINIIYNEAIQRGPYNTDSSLKYLFRSIRHIFIGSLYVDKIFDRELFISLRYLRNEKHITKNIKKIKFYDLNQLGIQNKERLNLIFKLIVILYKGLVKNKIKSSLVLFLALVFFEKLKKCNNEVTFIYYSELPEVFMLSKIAIDSQIKFNYLELSGYITESASIFCYRYTSIMNIVSNFARDIEYIKSEKYSSIYTLNDIKKNLSETHNYKDQKKIFYYTSGYYSRLKANSHSHEFLKENEKVERKILTKLAELSNKLDIELIVMPHYSRNVENIEDAIEYYNSFLIEFKKVIINTNNEFKFKNGDLSITYGSNVFFDNLFLGRKSIVIEGIKANYEFLTYSSINPFYYKISNFNTEKLSSLLDLSPKNFYEEKVTNL